jgi:hypothetical protein
VVVVTPQNLLHLVRVAPDCSLAQKCLDLERTVDDADFMWPPLVAAWRLYKESELRVVKGLDATGTTGVFDSSIPLADVLLWGSRYGSDDMVVVESAEQRSRCLAHHAVLVTRSLLPAALGSDPAKREAATQSIADLWSHSFAGVLPDVGSGDGDDAEGTSLPFMAYVLLAKAAPMGRPVDKWGPHMAVRCSAGCGALSLSLVCCVAESLSRRACA